MDMSLSKRNSHMSESIKFKTRDEETKKRGENDKKKVHFASIESSDSGED